MADVNSKAPKQVSSFELMMLDPQEPGYSGNIGLGLDHDYFTYGESDLERMTFGQKVANVFDKSKFTIPTKLPYGKITLSKELFEKLKLNEDLLKFTSDGHGKLLSWNIENNITTRERDKVKNPLFEATFADVNPYALTAVLAAASKENLKVHSAQIDMNAIEATPEIAKYLASIAQKRR